MLVPAEGWRQNQQNKSTTGSLSSTDGNTNAMFLVPRQLEVVRSPGTRCCSVTRSCLTLCNPMDHSMKGFPVLHYLLEFAQTYVYWVGDAIQPSPLPFLLLSIFPSIRVFSSESDLPGHPAAPQWKAGAETVGVPGPRRPSQHLCGVAARAPLLARRFGPVFQRLRASGPGPTL